MALIQCPECNAQVSDKALSCPHCGFPIIATEKPRKTTKSSARKHPKLPNGFGSIKKLSGNRTNPYAVYPPVTEFTVNGLPVMPKAIAYTDNWYKAFGLLSAYKGGTFKPGDAIEFDDKQITDAFVLDIISAYSYGISTRKSETDLTFKEVYEKFLKWEIMDILEQTTDADKIRKLKSRERYLKAAFGNCSALHEKTFCSITYEDLQSVIDNCPLKHASKEFIVVLLHKMYKFAEMNGITEKDNSRYIKIKTEDDDVSSVPFTVDELKVLWKYKEDPVVEMLIIMCLSGYRISAYRNLKIDLEARTFFGGVKTKNGINRTVPIHSGIYDMVKRRINTYGCLLYYTPEKFRADMRKKLEEIGVQQHTPHDCRSTFATLCDKFKVDKIYIKRMIGHSLASDITQSKYIEPSVEDLRFELEKIDLLLIVTNN